MDRRSAAAVDMRPEEGPGFDGLSDHAVLWFTIDAGTATRGRATRPERRGEAATLRRMAVMEEACSWLLAAELARRCGTRYRLLHTHPGGGQYDCLTFLPNGDVLPRLDLNRTGRITLHHGGEHEVIGGDRPWVALACGAASVAGLAEDITEHAGWPGEPMKVAPLAAMVAAALRSAALFGLPWSARGGRIPSAGPGGDHIQPELFEPYRRQLPVAFEEAVEFGERFWFLIDDHTGTPLACFDQWGQVLRPGASAEPIPEAAQAQVLADMLFAPLVARQVAKAGPDRVPGSGMGLPAVLSAFNRKERYYLFAGATGGLLQAEVHGASVALAEPFRAAIATSLGPPWQPPPHAWAATDYHLDWLHAALQWWGGATGPGRLDHLATTPAGGEAAKAVTGTQEDADLAVCWHDGEVTRLVLIEAKAYGAWSNKQATDKHARIRTILSAAPPTGLEVRWLLASPTAPVKLTVSGWEPWALVEGKPAWMPLPVPALRVATQRCDQFGRPSAAGAQWRITGPTPGR